jgi:BirA family biotin operon repressor/biotin-[acetyl-CoA-carboxylase] ligase
MEITELLLPSEIITDLKTEILGKRGIHYYQEIGSTNDRAKELALEGCPEGTLVIAESQISGRGRLGRKWESPKGGGLYFSLVLRPKFAPSQAPRITILAGVAVCKAIRSISPSLNAGIKWPNDILIKGKKVAGILTEIDAEIEGIHHIVLGIGINVNTEISALSEELKNNATSLFHEAGQKISRKALLCQVLYEIEKLYKELSISNFSTIIEEWKELNLTINQKVKVESPDGTITGKAIDIDDEGGLIILASNGIKHRITSGEVILLRKDN